jgi:DNA-binding response OmpR family regulator
MLERAGFSVRTVTSFSRLKELHGQEPATIIVTDNTLDDGTSDLFIGMLREREDAGSGSPTPVIVLTADARPQTRRELLVRGANLVLVKPAKADALVAAVLDLVARHAA